MLANDFGTLKTVIPQINASLCPPPGQITAQTPAIITPQPTPPPSCTSTQLIDIVFVLDETTSISSTQFEQSKQFMKQLLITQNAINLATSDIGFIEFGTSNNNAQSMVFYFYFK